MPSSSGWPERLWVTGTDTGVGKTLVSAVLVRQLGASYWKPIQTGTELDSDSDTVRALSGCGPERILPNAVALPAPLSPNQAAEAAGTCIRFEDIRRPVATGPLVMEGAGGVLVPVDDRHFLVDLMVRLPAPVVVAARSGLGTLNHTLLTLEALRRRELEVFAVVLIGDPHPLNARDIARFGRVPLVAQWPWLPEITPESIRHLHLG